MLPLNPAKIPELYQDALRQQAAGQLDAAAATYRRIAEVNPRIAEVHFQLGRIALSRKAFAEAAGSFDVAAKLKPKEAAIWQAYARAVEGKADAAAAAAFLAALKAARVDPALQAELQDRLDPATARSKSSAGRVPPAEMKRLIAMMQRGAYAEAERLAASLQLANRDVAVLYDIQAAAQAEQGKAEVADGNFRKAVALAPDHAGTRLNYGRFLMRRGRAPAAADQLRRAVDLDPKNTTALTQLGLALEATARPEAALAVLRKSLALKAGQPEARIAAARLVIAAGEAAAGLKLLEPLGKGKSASAQVRVLQAEALAALGQDDKALASYDAAIAAAPDSVIPLAEKGRMLQRLGRFGEAERAFRNAIAKEPWNGRTYHLFLVGHKLSPGDPLIAEMARLMASEEISDDNRMYLGFALAKALEDTGAHDRVFACLRTANAVMRARQPSGMEARRRDLQALMAAFEPVDFDRPVSGTTGYAPIFVTGLPRSGTTLVESILASHPDVTGGGELGLARAAASEAVFDASGAVADFGALPDTAIAGIGHKTEAAMRARFPNAERVTDKGVQSYTMFGPLRMALPAARFVLVERDPRDTAYSMYKTLFEPGRHGYAYDLRDLAENYRLYRAIVDFWQRKLPGAIHVIRYELLIADPETEARRLVAACGLDWDDRCLAFHENRRRVDTLSVHQVRQPLYATSVAAWQRHRAEMAEFVDALGDLAPEE